MDDIEKVINEGQTGPTGPAGQSGPTGPTEEEVKKAQLQKELADLQTAKAEATAELSRIRAEKRTVKKESQSGPTGPVEKVIDLNDPDAQAWDKHIKQSVSPALEELEKEKAEVRQFALEKFLASRPALAKNPEKLKELMGVYERLHTASERTEEGVLRDLDQAYAAVYHRELLEVTHQGKVDSARRDAIFSDIGVSRGSTAYAAPKDAPLKLSEEEQRILAKWNMSPSDWEKMKKEQDKKAQEAV